MRTSGCFVQTRPNTGTVFGRTNNTFGGTLSYVLPLFSTLVEFLVVVVNVDVLCREGDLDIESSCMNHKLSGSLIHGNYRS